MCIFLLLLLFCCCCVCLFFVFFLMIRRPPRSTLDRSSAASDVYKRQASDIAYGEQGLSFAVTEGNEKHLLQTRLIGQYNVSNLLGVMAACLLYTSPSPRDRTRSRMPSSA